MSTGALEAFEFYAAASLRIDKSQSHNTPVHILGQRAEFDILIWTVKKQEDLHVSVDTSDGFISDQYSECINNNNSFAINLDCFVWC